MARLRIAIAHGPDDVPDPGAGRRGPKTDVAEIGAVLRGGGHEVVRVVVDGTAACLRRLSRLQCDLLFNLVEGRLCARFYRRKDGTVMTRNCPIGMKVLAPLARITSFALAAALPFWGTLMVVHWQDIQAKLTGWIPSARKTERPQRPVHPERWSEPRMFLGVVKRQPSDSPVPQGTEDRAVDPGGRRLFHAPRGSR